MRKHNISRRTLLKLMGAGAAASVARVVPFKGFMPNVIHAQGTTKIRWMTWGGGKSLKTMLDSVTSNISDIGSLATIEVVDGGAGDQDVAAALRLALASGQNIPDVVQLNRTQVTEFAVADELMMLDDVYAPVKSDLYAGALALVGYGDHQVAFPFELKSKLFYYRADLFDKAGIDVTKIVTTDDFINAGKTLMDKIPTARILNLGPQPASYWMGELVSAYPGATYFADKQGKFSVTSNKGFAEGLGFLKSLLDAKITLPVDDWSSDWQPAIADGKIGSFLLANWLKFFLPGFAANQKGQWKVALWPQLMPLADQRYGSEAGGSVFIVPKRSPNAKLAAQVAGKIFLEAKGALAAFAATGVTPLVKSARDQVVEAAKNPKRPTGMADKDFAAQPSVFFGPDFMPLELQSYDYVKVLDYDPAASKGLDILNQWVGKVMSGSADVKAALSGAEADMKSQIGNPYQS